MKAAAPPAGLDGRLTESRRPSSAVEALGDVAFFPREPAGWAIGMSDPVSARPDEGPSPSRRAALKERTRQKVMTAAKQLFSTFGYEHTTIRQIAAECGLSTGALFASFSGKSELFLALVVQDRAAAYEVVGEALRERLEDPAAQIEDVLKTMFVRAYRSRAENVPFVQVAMSAAWSTELGPDIRTVLAQWPISDHISAALAAAVDRGQIAPDANIALLSQMLWDAALSMIPHAVFDAWPADQLAERLGEKIHAIMSGSRL